jgi:glycosyltransferase 2 family protein
MEPRTVPRQPMAEPQRPAHARGEQQARRHVWWSRAKRALSILFFAAVAALLARYGSHIEWSDVLDALTAIPMSALLLAIALAASSHVLYSCFDLIGRRYTGHNLPAHTVMAVSFVSYVFNLCIGSIVGGVGFRYRLYSRLGLNTGVITRIVSMSMLTNWLGYKLLAGLLFLIHPLALPPNWHMGNHGLQWVGAVLVAISASYLIACWRMGDRTWNWRGHELYLPPWRMAVLQMAISCLNWCLMAGVIYVLLGRSIDYTDVLTVLLIGAIAGVFAHVPAGLGVFEFVYVALLSHLVPQSRLLGALLGYRAIYYIAPLVVGALMYLSMEVRAKRRRRALRAEGRV